MMVIEKIRRWTSECDEGLCYAVLDERDELAAGVNCGALECYRLWHGEAYMVTRTAGTVLTCCCYQGARLKEAASWVSEQALARGITQIRFHTRRPALARLLKGFNFQPIEQVFAAQLGSQH